MRHNILPHIKTPQCMKFTNSMLQKGGMIFLNTNGWWRPNALKSKEEQSFESTDLNALDVAKDFESY